MAKCKICKKNIPDGEEYCKDCLDKKNNNTSNETYLDGLLNSIKNSNTQANNSKKNNQHKKKNDSHKEKSSPAKSEPYSANVDFTDFDQDEYLKDLQDVDLINFSNEDLFGSDFDPESMQADNDNEAFSEELHKRDTLLDSENTSENTEKTDNRFDENDKQGTNEDVNVLLQNKDANIDKEFLSDGITSKKVEEEEEDEDFEPSLGDLFNKLSTTSQKDDEMNDKSQENKTITDDHSEVSKQKSDDKNKKPSDDAAKKDNKDSQSVDKGKEEEDFEEDDLQSLLNQLNPDDPVTKDILAISNMVNGTEGQEQQNKDLSGEAGKQQNDNLPGDVGEVFSDALTAVSSLKDEPAEKQTFATQEESEEKISIKKETKDDKAKKKDQEKKRKEQKKKQEKELKEQKKEEKKRQKELLKKQKEQEKEQKLRKKSEEKAKREEEKKNKLDKKKDKDKAVQQDGTQGQKISKGTGLLGKTSGKATDQNLNKKNQKKEAAEEENPDKGDLQGISKDRSDKKNKKLKKDKKGKEDSKEKEKSHEGETKDQREDQKGSKEVKEKKNKKEKKKKKDSIQVIDDLEEEQGHISRFATFIIFLFFGIIVILLLLGIDMYSYSLSMKNAKTDFKRQKYTQAYNEVYGIDIKDEDIATYDKIMTVMFVNKQLNSYNNYYAIKKYPEALDSLLKGLERYDKYKELASYLGVKEDLDYVRNQIIAELSNVFNLSEKDAMMIIKSKTQSEYSIKVYDTVLENSNF